MCYEHQTCTTGFIKDSTTLQYPKGWVVTTFGIAGLQGNSINTTYSTMAHKWITLTCSMLLISPEHFMLLGVTQGADFKFFSSFNHF